MEPWLVPQDFYDMIMELPDGADVTEFFTSDDPQWMVTKITLFKTEDGHALLSCVNIVAMEPTSPTTQQTGTSS
jgi:hypothetical protein